MIRPPDPRLAQVRSVLADRGRSPVDDRERTSIARFGEALGRLSDPFDTDADPTHVTSSAIVVGEEGVVLLLHKRLGIWLQPGGHLDPGEDLAAAGMREAVEETGLALEHPPEGPRPVHVDVHLGGRGHIHLDLRWLLLGSGTPNPPPGESPDVRWFGWDAALATADPGLSGALRALRP
ncbi:MAG: hypothetical protein NVSMB16_03630 [Acidimicrobiales bacterium]